MIVHDGRLEEALEEYVRRYARRARDMTSASAALAALTTLAVEQVPGIDHAGVTLVTGGDIVRCLAATDGHPLVLDNIQRGCGEGPGLEAATSRQMFGIDDLTAESRWPRFTAKAVASTPVRALLALPVFDPGFGDDTYAALNLYADRPWALDSRAQAAGAMIAARVAETLTAGRGRRRSARSARTDAINEAKNLLMRRFGIDVAQAFALLVKLAKQQGDSIETVARELVSAAPS